MAATPAELSYGADGAWAALRRDWRFVTAAVLLCVLGAMAVAPGLFGAHAGGPCLLEHSLQRPSWAHPFGFDLQGCDFYDQTVLGARTSLSVGLLVVLCAMVIGLALGSLCGYYEGAVDALISRVADMVFAVPLVLGGAVVLALTRERGVAHVSVVLVALSWPPMLRLVRANVLSIKQLDFVVAARALGAGDGRLLRRHVLPSAVGPLLVYATVFVGIAISAEALLSFMGVGLQLPTVSWGLMLASVQYRIASAPHLLIPAVFLTAAVAAFVLLGEALRRAGDPRRRS